MIGAEDVDPDGYPYELVAQSWGATQRRRQGPSQNVRKPRKDKGKVRAMECILPECVEYVDKLGEDSDSCSSLSSFRSIPTHASNSSGITLSEEESGSDSECYSEQEAWCTRKKQKKLFRGIHTAFALIPSADGVYCLPLGALCGSLWDQFFL